MTTKLKELDRVEVFWEDANHASTQNLTMEEAGDLSPAIRRTLGYVVKSTRKHLYVAATCELIDGDQTVSDVNMIPKTLVRDIIPLVEVPKEVSNG